VQNSDARVGAYRATQRLIVEERTEGGRSRVDRS
jgi:hypothetical protein